MKKLLATLLLLTILLTTVTPVFAVAQAAVSNEAEEHILSELNRANIPNAAVAIIQGGETTYILKDSEHDTIFQIGSVAKSFTGFGVLLLEDMGFLSVSDPVNQHLPWFEVRYNSKPVPHDDITIYNLLQHTSGFTSDEMRFPSTVQELSTDELIERLIGIELAFYPSAGHIYGNVNYMILTLIIEAVSGQSYDDFMTQNVLHPLGLYNTFTDVERAYDTGRVSGGHHFGFFRPRPHNVQWGSQTMSTGGIYSSISDMARWAGIHLGLIEVSEQFTRVAQRSHENNHTSQNPFEDLGFVYAAGWGVSEDGFGFFEDGLIQHTGGTFGYFSIVMMTTENDSAFVMLSNFRHQNIGQWAELILGAMGGNYSNRIGIDTYAILDIIFIALTVLGVLFIGLLVRLAVKVSKQLQSGEKIKSKLRIRWFITPILPIIGLLFFYVVAPMLFGMPFCIMLLLLSASMLTAVIAMWIITVYSLFSLVAKVLGWLPVKKRALR